MNAAAGRAQAKRVLTFVLLASALGFVAWNVYTAVDFQGPEQAGGVASGIAAAALTPNDRITALGRLQPKDGVIRVAGPSQVSVVIAKLLVEKGDRVKAGQVIAVLDNYELLKATAERLRAELDHAESERQRHEQLYRDKVVSISERDNWRMKVNALQAEVHRAEVELDHAAVRAPIDGQVLDIHARAGEKVGPEGIIELGNTDAMYAVAEVYETDIGRVHLGQRATVTNPALQEPAEGTVDRIGLKIGKLDVFGTDPVAQTDARVVEVEIRLDDSQRVAALTNLQVEVAITP